MLFLSWNIDGLNAALENKSSRGMLSYDILSKLNSMQPEAICLQETKLSTLSPKNEKALMSLFPGYKIAHNVSTARKGYAGTMTLYKGDASVLPVENDFDVDGSIDNEGRLTVLEYESHYLVNVYTVNAGGKELKTLDKRLKWDEYFRNRIESLMEDKPVILCGDFNVAHEDIDLKNPKGNKGKAGFTDEERESFTKLLGLGLTDTLRDKLGDEAGHYTWFTQLSPTAKANNSGWRIDYFIVSNDIKDNIVDSYTIDSGERKDHSPIALSIDL